MKKTVAYTRILFHNLPVILFSLGIFYPSVNVLREIYISPVSHT